MGIVECGSPNTMPISLCSHRFFSPCYQHDGTFLPTSENRGSERDLRFAFFPEIRARF